MARHTSYFEVLGLDAAPKDRKEVKRAYSKQLKKTRPEDDPDGFMQLRDAHDIALNILARQAEQAEWEAQQKQHDTHETVTSDDGLTYVDMIPEGQAIVEDLPSPTSYSIGASPTLDAPAQFDTASNFEISGDSNSELETQVGPEPEAPREPPLLQDIVTLLDSPESYNNRDKWNQLFRNARQLDIDDYVDFEQLLMDNILRLHGYFDGGNPHFDQPEKLPQLLSPSLSASLFKTMQWDKVGKLSYHKANQIEWLNRRMRITQPNFQAVSTANVPPPNTPSALARWFWPALGLLMAIALFADLMTT